MSTITFAPAVAAATRSHQASDAERFKRGVILIARQLYFSCPAIDEQDRRFLSDVAREEGRYQLKAIQRLARISRESVNPAHRQALTGLIQEFSGASDVVDPAIDLGIAFDRETTINGECNNAQRAFERFPTPANQQRVVEALAAQEALSREARLVAQRTPVRKF